MAEEKKTAKAADSQAAPKKTAAKAAAVKEEAKPAAKAAESKPVKAAEKPAAKAEVKEKAKTAAPAAKAAEKPVAKAEVKEAAKTAEKTAPSSARAAAPAPKKAAVKKGAPVIVNNRVVAQSKTPLYNALHKKGTAPYAISKQEVKVTLVKSTIGAIQVHKKTVEALGLKKIGQSKTFKKSPALDGMLFRVRHLIKVEEVR